MAATRQTLDQQRARFAWEAAEGGRTAHGKDYQVIAKGASALVMGSGLMPTLGFLASKERLSAHGKLRDDLCRWLGQRFAGHPEFQPASGQYPDVMERLHKGSSALYMEATNEALAILKWIRQYVDAVPSARGTPP